ncbi:molybdenum cofactor biosynthesis protein MoaE [Acidihalobacter prosperus]
MSFIKLEESSFDPWRSLSSYVVRQGLDQGQVGAASIFVGTMRDLNLSDQVTDLFLEHYPGMTERELARIADETETYWSLADCLIIHRVGHLYPGEPIVLTAAWSSHRGAAFEACRHLIETLKHRAPFWKRETLQNGTRRWVEKNTKA